MDWKSLEILHDDNHLLVVNKPAELPTQGAAAGEASLVTLAKQYIKHEVPQARECLPGSGQPAGLLCHWRGRAGPHLQGGRTFDQAV